MKEGRADAVPPSVLRRELWEELPADVRRRVKRAVRRGEPLSYPDEAALAAVMARIEIRRVRRLMAVNLLPGVFWAGFVARSGWPPFPWLPVLALVTSFVVYPVVGAYRSGVLRRAVRLNQPGAGSTQ